MFKNVFSILVFVSLAACSSEEAVTIPGQAPGESSLIYTKTVRPSHVPAVLGTHTYFGFRPLTVDEEFEFYLTEGEDKKVADFEYQSATRGTLVVDDLVSLYSGRCPKRKRRLTWYSIDGQGRILAKESVGTFQTVTVFSGVRHLLRVEFTGTKECTNIYTQIKIENT